MTNRNLELLYEIGSLKNVPRGWRQYLAMDVASVLEHTFRATFLALIIARREGVKTEEKILKMALVHDIFETRISEITYVPRVYVKPDTAKASKDMFFGTSLSDLEELIKEYEKCESIEAKIIKDADALDIDIEL